MKIKIKSIKQELKKPDDDLKTQIIRAFINAEEGSDHSNLINSLKNLNIDPCQAISYLDKEEVAPQLYTKAVEIHNSFCKNEVKVDAFGNFPKIGHDLNQTPGSNKNIESGRNFMQENNMKISQEYLKQIIQEEIQEALSADQMKNMKTNSMNLKKDRVKVKGRHLKTQIPRAGNEPDIVPDDEENEED